MSIFGKNKNKNISSKEADTISCVTKVLDKMENGMKESSGKLRDDINFGRSSSEIHEFKMIKEKTPDVLFDICARGKGKDFVEFMDKVRPIFISESNRLGRILTKEEIIEICNDIKDGRR